MSHIGRELELMINGKKAMAAFCRFASEDIDPTGGQDFSSKVRSGEIRANRFSVDRPDGKRVVYTVYYKPDEEWRFALYKQLKKSINAGWNIDKEIIENILLDYDRESLGQYLRLLKKRN